MFHPSAKQQPRNYNGANNEKETFVIGFEKEGSLHKT